MVKVIQDEKNVFTQSLLSSTLLGPNPLNKLPFTAGHTYGITDLSVPLNKTITDFNRSFLSNNRWSIFWVEKKKYSLQAVV